MLLPGILPRVHDLVDSGFGYLAFLFATVYRTVRILPPNHPYLNPANMGKFGVLQVIAAASNHVHLDRKHLDQIVVFFALLAGLVLIFLQFGLLILTIFTGQAFAQDEAAPFQSIFRTPYPQNDIAFLMLDYVFGIPAGTGFGPNLGWFGSTAIPTGSSPFHQGLHALFNFYNLAILLVGVLIFLYYIIVVVIETAQTGVPFGKRFSKLYAPFRLIVAVGLLVPLNYGFNGAQYITLYAAKIGSSFATNGWILYNDALAEASSTGNDTETGGGEGGRGASTNNPTGAPNSSLVARPRTPSVDELLYFSSVYHACREMYRIWNPQNFQTPSQGGTCIGAYVVANGRTYDFLGTNPGQGGNQPANNTCAPPEGQETAPGLTYTEAKGIFRNNDMEVVLGEYNTTEHGRYAGSVRPYCGKITVSLSNDNPSIYTQQQGGGGGAAQNQTGIRAIENMWYTELQQMLRNAGPFAAFGERAAHFYVPTKSEHNPCWRQQDLGGGGGGACTTTNWFPAAEAFVMRMQNYRSTNSALVMNAYIAFRNNLDLALQDELRRRGWGGAGIWYNHIADLNGSFAAAVYAAPTVRQFPEVMEVVKQARQTQDTQSGICSTYDPNLADNKPVEFSYPNELYTAKALNAAYKYHICDRPAQDSGAARPAGDGDGREDAAAAANNCADQSTSAPSGYTRGMTTNTFINVVSLIFGINGLFDIRCNSTMDEATGMPRVHPLAQLAVVGKSLIENAIRSMAMAVGASFGGGIIGVLNQSLGSALEAASGMFVGIATIGLTAGFLLYYILPFLPFMYFFFAVGSWVKSIFEAMVGVPLWALAHLHIDGDGLPGRAAMGGYFLIFEIALRPIFTIFGLIAGMAVFGAMAAGLNNLFDLVVVNITGATPSADSGTTLMIGTVESVRRGVIDQFFFTIMYAVLLYMMATTSFKMIDQIPQHVMRWIGSSVPIFNDNKQDPTSGLTTYTALAGNQIVPQMLGGVRSGASGVGKGLGEALKMAGGDNQSQGGNNG